MQTQHFLFIALPLCQEQLLEPSDSLANLLFVSLQIDLLLMFKSSFYSSQFLLVMHEVPKNVNMPVLLLTLGNAIQRLAL